MGVLYKKGQLSTFFALKTVVGLVMILLIYVSTFMAISSIKDYTIFEQSYMARDFATTIEMLYAASGNIEVIYPYSKPTYWFAYETKDNMFSVIDSKGEIAIERYYPFVKDNGLTLYSSKLTPALEKNGTLARGVRPVCYKRGNTIGVEEESGFAQPSAFDCSYIPANYNSAGKSAFTGFMEEYRSEESQKLDSMEIIVVADYGSSEGKNSNGLKAYFMAGSSVQKESEKLACLVVKEIIESAEISSLVKSKGLSVIKGYKPVPLSNSFFSDGKVMVLLVFENKDMKSLLLKDSSLRALVKQEEFSGVGKCC